MKNLHHEDLYIKKQAGNTVRVYFDLQADGAYIQSVEIAKNDPSYIKIHTHGDYRPEDKQAFIDALTYAYEVAFEGEGQND